MTYAAPITATAPAPIQRAQGEARISTKRTPYGTGLDRLYQKGAYKAVFPRSSSFTGVLVNTSGGVTGGDSFDVSATAGPGTTLTLTTQAAERAYKALPGEVGTIRTRLSIKPNAICRWLPQETIVFDGANLSRKLRCDLAPASTALIVEPLILGRAAMGETQVQGRMSDLIEIWQDDTLRHLDAWTLEGDLTETFKRPAIGEDAMAMANIVFCDPAAEAHLDQIRTLLPQTAGASLKAPDLLVARILAPNGYVLRQSLLPILDYLTQNTLPTCWRL